jgi:hypothetical protein
VTFTTTDEAAVAAGLIAGDDVLATGNYFDGTLRVDHLRYDNVPFAVSAQIRFEGLYQATPTPAANTLTIMLKNGNNITFNLDASTKYFRNGHRLAHPPIFHQNERTVVWAVEYTDQSWLASIVNVLVPRP